MHSNAQRPAFAGLGGALLRIPEIPMPARAICLFRHNHLETFSVNVQDLDAFIRLQMTPQLCDVNIHGPAIEIVGVSPNGLERVGAFKQVVSVLAQQKEKLIFLRGEALL